MMTPYYDKNGITIYCGDCLEIMPQLDGPFDAVITDPPYGLKRNQKGYGYTRFLGYGAETNGLEWDKPPDTDTFRLILAIGKYHIIWGANNFDLPPSQSFLVWYKRQTVDNFADAELAYCDIPGLTAKVFDYSIGQHNVNKKRCHPTEKPLPLMIWCLQFLPNSDGAILDPFMGSGTTLVAAQQLGGRATGIELSEDYCRIAVERLRQQSIFSLPEMQQVESNHKQLEIELNES